MTSPIAAARNAFSRIALGDPQVARNVLRVGAKGAFLVMLALMIAAYAVSASQSAPPPPEPLPDFIYS
ncbi:MAG: hypothetical protein JSR72_07235 [Proteobacteria bacterium]|nr:hypothetical protein [Pseudomonadota bacterium]